MAKVSIIPVDGVIVIAGEAQWVDMAGAPADVHAVQWDTDTNTGEIEFTDNRENEVITSLPGWTNPIQQRHATAKQAQQNAAAAAQAAIDAKIAAGDLKPDGSKWRDPTLGEVLEELGLTTQAQVTTAEQVIIARIKAE